MNKDRKNEKSTATKQEIFAALKLIELLYLSGKLPKHVYENIRREYSSS